MEEKVITRGRIHGHPLILKENVCKEERVNCFVCGNPIANLELAYVCMEEDCISRDRRVILHKKCGELPDEIRHSKHPHHSMFLNDLYSPRSQCDLCHRSLYSLFGYKCRICNFDVDITCKKVGIDALLEDKEELQHPSHPHHPLTLMRKPAFSFFCDGCGAQDVDMAYICSTCEIWVHKTCASLPLVCECRHHHHRLSLAFSFPEKHLNLYYDHDKCDVCDKYFDRTCWVYYCDDCRYFVHVKCVGSTPQPNLINEEDDDVIELPLYAEEISNKLITPFVMREKGDDNISIPVPVPDTSTTTSSNSIFIFKYHDHPLSLVLESKAEATDDELKICDVCISPITSHPYYKCSAYANCTYFIHYICCFLPTTLHPNPQLYGPCLLHKKNHNFTLYAPNSKSEGRDAISYWECHLCVCATNGMGYKCDDCRMKIDVKCASLPTTIRHASHPHHKPLLLTRRTPQEQGVQTITCRVCYYILDDIAYSCSEDECDFALDLKCVMLPKSIREREWDKHPLLLMSDASLDHPSDFFCEFCEGEMDPKAWMYHCRQCDVSFHRSCSATGSGWFRNVKFGRRYELDGIHPNHPLTFTYITLKKRCDVCHRYVYTYVGLECAPCYYVVCEDCGGKELEKYRSSDKKNHNFTLYAPNSKSKGSSDAISYWWCGMCKYFCTNGMGYKCEDCGMKIDIKCASLPTTIRYAFHLHHKPLLLTTIPPHGTRKRCHGCNWILNDIGYCCSEDECDFALDLRCVMLPKSIREPEWDKHPLLLMSDASLDHPSDFFCEQCEIELPPKKWMYHCRQCDVSFHLDCLRNASGWYRNVKFGRQYELDGIHPNHPLTFTYITLKRHCDLCAADVYTYVGLECASCYYVVCSRCGRKELEKNRVG